MAPSVAAGAPIESLERRSRVRTPHRAARGRGAAQRRRRCGARPAGGGGDGAPQPYRYLDGRRGGRAARASRLGHPDAPHRARDLCGSRTGHGRRVAAGDLPQPARGAGAHRRIERRSAGCDRADHHGHCAAGVDVAPAGGVRGRAAAHPRGLRAGAVGRPDADGDAHPDWRGHELCRGRPDRPRRLPRRRRRAAQHRVLDARQPRRRDVARRPAGGADHCLRLAAAPSIRALDEPDRARRARGVPPGCEHGARCACL